MKVPLLLLGLGAMAIVTLAEDVTHCQVEGEGDIYDKKVAALGGG
jgi:hypothetical protein